MRVRIKTGTGFEWGGILSTAGLSFPSWKGSSCSQGAPTVKTFIHNRAAELLCSHSQSHSCHCQEPPGPGGAGGAGTSLLSWPVIPDLGFSAAETQQFLTGHVRTSRRRDLSINPCSNSSGHWRQPQISLWNTRSKIPRNKRVLSSETAENTWF